MNEVPVTSIGRRMIRMMDKDDNDKLVTSSMLSLIISLNDRSLVLLLVLIIGQVAVSVLLWHDQDPLRLNNNNQAKH